MSVLGYFIYLWSTYVYHDCHIHLQHVYKKQHLLVYVVTLLKIAIVQTPLKHQGQPKP